jgi:hypothetical protein
MSVRDLLAATTMAARREPQSYALHGIVVPGSYVPTPPLQDGNPAGTLMARIGTSMAIELDGSDGPLDVLCYLLTPYNGLQGGPIGGERCLLFPTEDGAYGCLIYQSNDDTPGAPAGELWLQRYTADIEPPDQKQYVRIQTDGCVRVGAAAKFVVLAPVVNLGLEDSQADDGVVTRRDMQAALNAQQQVFQSALNALCKYLQTGQGVPPPNVGSVSAQASMTVFAAE